MRFCEQTSLAMTHLSMKIGRFICDSGVEVSNARIFGSSSSRGFRCNGGYDEEEDDDDPEPEVDDRSGSDVIPSWRDYDYDRTLRPYRNDRILSLLSRVVRSMDFTSGSPPEADEGEGEGGGSEPEETRPLPWRSTEAMSAVEDSSKYLREETAPAVQDNDDDDNQNSHSQSLSSLSGSSSFRNIPSPDACYDPPAPRPDPLSAGGGGGLSLRLQWLTEAESRHSEPFCPAHHRPSSPPEPRSSITGHHHRIPPQPHDPHPHHPGRRHRTRDPHSQSQSQSGSSYGTPYSFPSVLGEEGGEEVGAGSPNRRDQVLRWLMANDLEVTARLDEEADDRMTDVVCSGGGPSIIASGWSRDSRPRIIRDDDE